MESLRLQLRDYKIEYVTREDKMKKVIEKSQQYLKENESSLVTLCHDMRSTSEALRTAVDDGDMVTGFEQVIIRWRPTVHSRTYVDKPTIFLVFLLLCYLPVFFQEMVVRSGTIHK